MTETAEQQTAEQQTAEQQAPAQPERGEIFLVHLGTFPAPDGEKESRWVRVTREEIDDPGAALDIETDSNRQHVYAVDDKDTRRYLDGAQVGAVYRFAQPAGKSTSIYPSTIRWVGLWGNIEDRTRWRAAADTARVELELRAAEKRARKDNPLREQLAVVRAAYHRLPYPRRRLYLAQIIAEITGGTAL